MMFSSPPTLTSPISKDSVPGENFDVWMAKFTIRSQPHPHSPMKMVGDNRQFDSSFLWKRFCKEKLMHPNSRSQASIIVACVKSSPLHFKTKPQNLFIIPHSVSFGSLLITVHPSVSIQKSTIPMPSSRNIKGSWNYLRHQGNNTNVLSRRSCWAQTRLILPNLVQPRSGQFMHSLGTSRNTPAQSPQTLPHTMWLISPQ